MQVRQAGEIWGDGVWQELQSGDVGRDKARQGRDLLLSCHLVASDVIREPRGAISGTHVDFLFFFS